MFSTFVKRPQCIHFCVTLILYLLSYHFFSKANMTLLLEKNKQVLNQITTLSTLMVRLSSCIKFDRYRGYDSVDELNDIAHDLAKNRDLYASESLFRVKDDHFNPLISLSSIGQYNMLLGWITVNFASLDR